MKLWGKIQSGGAGRSAGRVSTSRVAGLALVVSGMVGCAADISYDAPWGTQLVVGPSEIVAFAGTVVRLQAWVTDEDGESVYNKVQMTVTSSYPGVLIVPQTAIRAYSDDDTTWQVGSEHYYELTEVDNQIDPTYLETYTDSSGMADVFVYMRCLPAKCESVFTDTCNLGLCGPDASPELQAFEINFYTSAATATVKSATGG